MPHQTQKQNELFYPLHQIAFVRLRSCKQIAYVAKNGEILCRRCATERIGEDNNCATQCFNFLDDEIDKPNYECVDCSHRFEYYNQEEQQDLYEGYDVTITKIILDT